MTPASRIAHRYDVLSLLGAGGMGEVYLARDLRLGREVALKFIARRFAGDPAKRARFEREARFLAGLHHPNVAAIHGIETSAEDLVLVLEHVPGESLRDRLARSPLSLDEALSVASQVAAGLSAAHDVGIVHRDVKPANVRIRPDGVVKLLDFGLAKALDPDTEELRSEPTLTQEGSAGDAILGTPGYLSPEQARGLPCDRRTDVWSFGCVLFETLAGSPAFPGATAGDRIAAVLKDEPDWTLLPAATPPVVRDLIGRMLEKDADRRLRDLADVRLLIEAGNSASPASLASLAARREPPARRTRIGLLWRAAALLLAASLGVATGQSLGDTAPRRTPQWLGIPIAEQPAADLEATIDISQDGQRIVYACAWGVANMRDRSSPTSHRIEAGQQPFFSPDGRWVAGFGHSLQKVGASGGLPVSLGPPTVLSAGGCWLNHDVIVFAPGLSGPLLEVSAGGGEARPVTTLDVSRGEVSHRWPHALPDARGFTYTAKTGDLATFDDATIRVHLEAGGEDRILVEGGMDGRVTSSGHLLLARGGRLLAAAVDPETLALSGAPVTVLEGLVTDPSTGRALYALSRSGDLVYVAGPPRERASRLVWMGPRGEIEDAGLSAPIHQAALAPDGERVAFVVYGANDKIWIAHLREGWLRQLTFGPGNDHEVAWSPNGRSVVFTSDRDGDRAVFVADINSTGGARRLASHGHLQFGRTVPTADGVLYFPGTEGGTEVWLAPWDGSASRLVVSLPQRVWSACISPDLRWLAYLTTQGEAWVEEFPGPGAKLVGPTNVAGLQWTMDGSALVHADRGADAAIRVTPFLREPEPSLGPTRLITRRPDLAIVAMVEERLLLRELEPSPAPQLHLVTGFADVLEREAPTGRSRS